MPEETKNKSAHRGWNRALIALLSILLVFAGAITLLRDNLINASKAYLFLKESKAFESIAEITKESIRSNLPDKVKQNFVEKAIIEKVMDLVITPENVAKIAEPGLKTLYSASGKLADLAEQQIVYNTLPIKEQAQKYLPGLGLPPAFSEATVQLVKAVPDEIKILDAKNNPNSPLNFFLKVRNAYRVLDSTANILWIMIVVNLVGILLLNIKLIARLFRSLGWAFGIAAAATLIISWIAPEILKLFLAGGTTASEQSINELVINLGQSYFSMLRGYGWLYLLISALSTAIYYLISSEKVSELIKNTQKKLIKKSPRK